MNKLNRTIFCITLLTSLLASSKDVSDMMNMGMMESNFSFDDVFDKAHAQIERVEAELKQALNTMPSVSSMAPTIIGNQTETPTVTDDDHTVHIAIKLAEVNFENMVMKKVDGKNGEQLVVTVPFENHTVELIIKEETLTVATKQEAVKEQEAKDNRSSMSAFGVCQTIQSLPSKVILNEPQAEYDEAKETLTISLKKADQPKSHVIPIKKK